MGALELIANGEVLSADAAKSKGAPVWERQATDTDRSWEGFEIFRGLGPSRTFVKVASELQKSDTLVRRWSHDHNWVARVQAWDRHQARVVNERVLIGTADMRQRMVNQALSLQARAHARIVNMTDAEIQHLRPSEAAILFKVGAEIERHAREIDTDELSFAPDVAPNITIDVVRPGGPDMVGIKLGTRYGYIPRAAVERFRERYPEAIVLI